METVSAEVVVVGGGPAGLTSAIALAEAGIKTALVSARPRSPDNRTTALLAGSVQALTTLGVWDICRTQAAPLQVLRIIDDTRRLLRAPEVCFDAREIGLDAFGFNIENGHLIAAMETRARGLPALALVADEAVEVVVEHEKITVECNGASIEARLVIGADGRNSLCRSAAAIARDSRRYPQTALTFNIRHSRPHGDAATEFHTQAGPFTLVPLPGLRSSLVFVVDPTEAPRLAALSDVEISAEIERRSHSILGRLEVEPGRGVFPLVVEVARAFGAHRAVLIGEAAHVLPPIGAQGLNLGLRDAATIAELAVAAHRDGRDPGSPELTARYEHMRRADVMSRSLAVDLLNRSLLSDFLPWQAARGLGLFLTERLAPLRRAAMREGIAPAASQPRLMRGEAL
ncbi:MAG TPA: UbiH/UbiF family hydroxylase [Xanthobacteraceae bacterium]